MDYYGWGFALLASSEMLWVVTIGWSIALVICQCRSHIAGLFQALVLPPRRLLER